MKARIERDVTGVFRIFCKRDKYKHWFELGKHKPTDMAFSKALKDGSIVWESCIIDRMQLFLKNF